MRVDTTQQGQNARRGEFLIERIEAAASYAAVERGRRPPTEDVCAAEITPSEKLSSALPANAEGLVGAHLDEPWPQLTSGGPLGAAKPFSLNFAALHAQGYVTPLDPRGRLAEEMRLLKRRLFTLVNEPSPVRTGNGPAVRPVSNLFLVTSPERGVGKSFVAENLALSLAQDESEDVLLINADTRPKRAPFGIPRAPGVSELLQGTATQDDIIHRASELPIAVLSLDSSSEAIAPLLAADAMSRLLRDLSRRTRWIVVDAPPLLDSSEAAALCRHAAQVLLVNAAERTQRRAIRAALGVLAPCDRVSLVLNEAAAGFDYGWDEGTE